MIYEMLSGRPPFRGSDLRETYKNVLFAEVTFVPTDVFSREAQGLIAGEMCHVKSVLQKQSKKSIFPHS